MIFVPYGSKDAIVSCLMVTQSKRWQEGPPVGARSFLEQSYPHRELVIVTADPHPAMDEFAFDREDVRIFDVSEEMRTAKLGALRQLTVEMSSGEFVATWDDDDVSQADRIKEQLRALRGLPDSDACLCLRVGIADELHRRSFTSMHGFWPMTMLARRESLAEYQADLHLNEDTTQIGQMRRILLLDRPELFTYVIHPGSCSSDAEYANEVYEESTREGV